MTEAERYSDLMEKRILTVSELWMLDKTLALAADVLTGETLATTEECAELASYLSRAQGLVRERMDPIS